MKKAKLSLCEESRFPDIPDLRFYESEERLLYFSAAHYLTKKGATEKLNVRDFFAKFDYLVGALCEAGGIPQEELTVCDENGEIYLEECLTILFLSYAERWFGAWMYLRMEELLRFGVTLNDNMTRLFYETRFEPQTIDPPK